MNWKRKNILRAIEPYYVSVSYMFIGFFIMMTGIHIIPMVAEVARDGSWAPFFYALSIIIGFIYFFFYKVSKLINSDDDEGELK